MEKSIAGVEKDAGSSSSTIAIAMNVTTTQGWMSDKEKRILNNCRLLQLLEQGTRILRQIFRKRWASYMAHCNIRDLTALDLEWKDGSECGLLLVKMCNKVNLGKQMKEKIQIGNITSWDITLVAAAIQALTQSNGVDAANNTEEDRHLEAVRNVRNELFHLAAPGELPDEQFNELWERASTALSALGADKGRFCRDQIPWGKGATTADGEMGISSNAQIEDDNKQPIGSKEQPKTEELKKVEESRHRALVVCWNRTEVDSFFLQIDEDEGQYGSAARIQANNSMLNGLGGKTELGAWYRMEYSRYTSSNTHVLVHEIVGARKRRKSFRTRVVEDDQVQFKIVVNARQNGGDGINFKSSVGPIKIDNVPKNLKEKLDGFTAWCKLNPKLVNDQNRFIFMQEEGATDGGGVVKTTTTLSNGVIANNIVGKPNEQKQMQKCDQSPKVTTNCIRNGVAVMTTKKPNVADEKAKNIEEAFEDEVAIQPELLNSVLEKVMVGHEGCNDCRVELSTECTNGIKVTGRSKEAVKKCVARIKKIRNAFMKELPKQISDISIERNISVKDSTAAVSVNSHASSIPKTTNKSDSPNTLHIPNYEEVGDNDGFWRIWKFECDNCMIAQKSWPNHMEKTEAVLFFYPILTNCLDAINRLSKANIVWPSQMAKAIDSNKKIGIGIAIFREGIMPPTEHSRPDGGHFSMELHGKINHYREMNQLDEIFHAFVVFIFGGGMATEGMRSAVTGIFVRAEIQMESQQRDPNNLPGTFRFELWIQDMRMQYVFQTSLAKWIEDVRKELGIEKKIKISFNK